MQDGAVWQLSTRQAIGLTEGEQHDKEEEQAQRVARPATCSLSPGGRVEGSRK